MRFTRMDGKFDKNWTPSQTKTGREGFIVKVVSGDFIDTLILGAILYGAFAIFYLSENVVVVVVGGFLQCLLVASFLVGKVRYAIDAALRKQATDQQPTGQEAANEKV